MYRISPKFRQNGVDWQFNMHVESPAGDPTVPGIAVNGAFESTVLGLFGLDCQYLGCQVGDPHGQTIAGQMVPSDTVPFGTSGNVALPAVICYRVNLYDGVYGLGRVGGWFVSGVPADAYDGNVLSTAWFATAKTAWEAFFASVNSDAGQINVWSPKDSVGYPVFRIAVATTLREQKRREFGRSIGKHGAG
jgi:hypothetical protein